MFPFSEIWSYRMELWNLEIESILKWDQQLLHSVKIENLIFSCEPHHYPVIKEIKPIHLIQIFPGYRNDFKMANWRNKEKRNSYIAQISPITAVSSSDFKSCCSAGEYLEQWSFKTSWIHEEYQLRKYLFNRSKF